MYYDDFDPVYRPSRHESHPLKFAGSAIEDGDTAGPGPGDSTVTGEGLSESGPTVDACSEDCHPGLSRCTKSHSNCDFFVKIFILLEG